MGFDSMMYFNSCDFHPSIDEDVTEIHIKLIFEYVHTLDPFRNYM